MMILTQRLWFLTGIILALLLSACASSVPEAIKKAPVTNYQLESVQDSPESFINEEVRWGGIILETKNTKDQTVLTVLAQKLSRYGEPISSDQSPGRFLAIIPRFLEPAVYAPQRKLTVRGKLLRFELKKVGEFDYNYPVVEVNSYYLWPVEIPQSERDAPPWWYDPWYDPYYPYYPYWHHRHP